MRTLETIIFSLILSALFISCSDNSTGPLKTFTLDTTSFKYPYTIGSSWDYKITISLSDFKPDTIAKYFQNYPLTITGTVSIVYDTVINGVTTRCFLDYEQPSGGSSYYYRNYYLNTDTALILYAIRGHGENFPDYLKHFTKSLSNVSGPGNDTLIITNAIILKYPIQSGTEWILYGSNNTFTDKKYIDFEEITVPAGNFSCIKLQKTYSYFTNATLYDFYSKYGLMKRTTLYDDILMTTPEFPEGIGTADMYSEDNITSYTIH